MRTNNAQNRPARLTRRIVASLAILVIVGALLTWLFVFRSSGSTDTGQNSDKPQKNQQSTQNNNDVIRFIATGDMLPHDTVNQAARRADGSYDYRQFFSQVRPYMKADVSFCNQESPSSPNFAVSGYPTFNAPSAFASDLSAEGCNLINLANNHADDKGQAGINDTLDVWSKLPTLAVAGTAKSASQQQKIAYFTVKNVRFAFLSYAQCSNNTAVSSYGLNIFSQQFALRQINEAKQNADVIIAAMHSCVEDKNTPDSWQTGATKFFADNGVSIVIGTGPHWLQPVQQLARGGGGQTLVWYSLGNFLSTQLDVNGMIGGIAVMDIDTKTKSVTDFGFLPTYMHYEWTAQQKASEDLLARHNLMIYPLDKAAEPLARSQLDTTVEAQSRRVTDLMTSDGAPVKIYTSQSYPLWQ